MRSQPKPISGPPGRMAAATGYTLLELLIVLAIMGLILIVVPKVTAGLPRFQLHAASASLANSLRQLRDDAIRSQQPTEFELDARLPRYRLTGRPGWQQLPASVDAVRFSRDTPLRAEPERLLRFFPDGSSNGGTVILYCGSQTAEVTVEWLSGRVKND